MRVLKSIMFFLIISIICNIGITAYAVPKNIEDRLNKWESKVDKLPNLGDITLREHEDIILELVDEFVRVKKEIEGNKNDLEAVMKKYESKVKKAFEYLKVSTNMRLVVEGTLNLNENSTLDRVKGIEELYKEANFSEKQLKSLDKEIKILEDFKKKLSGNEKKENAGSENSNNKTNEKINKDKSQAALALNKDEPTNSDNNKLEDTVSTKSDSDNNIKYIIGGIVACIIIILLIVRYLKIKKDERQGYAYYANNEWFKIKKK